MRIVTVGAGPAGLYFSLLMKKVDPAHDVTVVERNARDATYGWGVVFSEETLGALREADLKSHTALTDAFAKWDAIDIRHGGELVRSRGHSFSAIARRRLLEILQDRGRELGVRMRFQEEVGPLEELGPSDLLVGADGVNSAVRSQNEGWFGPSRHEHGTAYIWFGTDLVFKAFTFIFRATEHGLFQVHGYPFDASTSTFIVECPLETWRRAGLDGASEEESIAFCQDLFAEELGGHRLMSNRSTWMRFVTLRNETWHRGRVALLGDAAHTAHFTIGSGTKLAMEDAIALAGAFERHGEDVASALRDYEMERQPVVERFQQAALESAAYFENVSRYDAFSALPFSFNLLTRSGRITHLELERRDAAFVAAVDRWFARQAAPDREQDRAPVALPVAPPPALAPLGLGGLRLANRVAVALAPREDADDGRMGGSYREALGSLAASGAGLVLTDPVAASPEGRIGPASPGLWDPSHVRVWERALSGARAGIPRGEGEGVRFGLLLSHAGRRASTGPRGPGVDRPAGEGGWTPAAPSPLPYTRRSPVPQEVDATHIVKLLDRFGQAAQWAAQAGFDLLELDMGQGYLLASFLSPLTNLRRDRYGGSLEARMRLPLEVFERVRGAWPREGALAVRLTATDWSPRGLDADDAVRMARALRDRGCDLIHVVAGQTIEHDRPEFGRFYLIPFSDRIRNDAGVPTLVGGHLETRDEVNTILAAGRADLCCVEV